MNHSYVLIKREDDGYDHPIAVSDGLDPLHEVAINDSDRSLIWRHEGDLLIASSDIDHSHVEYLYMIHKVERT